MYCAVRRSVNAARSTISACIESMVQHGNLMVTAWNGDTLVGVARAP